jgi:uncharacterized protein
MLHSYLDGSALAKRYCPEPGSAVVDHLFGCVPPYRLVVLSVGLAEVVSLLVRKRNAGSLTPARFGQAIRALWAEVGPLAAVRIFDATVVLAERACDLIDRHSINSTDAILLRSALDLATGLRTRGDDLLLVASDRRLIRAAGAEGLTTFDPEAQSAADLDALLGP